MSYLEEIFISFALVFLGSFAYLAGGIIPAMALTEIKSTKEIIKTLNNILIAVSIFVLIYYSAGYLLASFLSAILLILLFTPSIQEKYFMFLPLILGGAIIAMELNVLILVILIFFIKGMIDYEKASIKRNKTKVSWKDNYINNIFYLISTTIIVMFILGLVH
ncbi:hypothetical protein COV13_01980 [Candidatus Woesearchaeota archaeon CG10_big_fil_rev_8_21_14_0_10_32_9]|nr:MAG: hypothetical protein COV13_01980 [Candidatus Woesearchaeota archaeon CG10_big_fil_rev_8_21_14_0_10_32_9]